MNPFGTDRSVATAAARPNTLSNFLALWGLRSAFRSRLEARGVVSVDDFACLHPHLLHDMIINASDATAGQRMKLFEAWRFLKTRM